MTPNSIRILAKWFGANDGQAQADQLGVTDWMMDVGRLAS